MVFGVTRQTARCFAMLACAVVPFAVACSSAGGSAATASSTVQAASGPKPTFSYPGDRQCAIIYRDNGNGTMSWTATVTVAGELRTHASDQSGDLYSHNTQVSVGQNTFTAPQPHSQVDDIGGVLYAGSASYACSVAPQR
jgi:hypothetical protein